MRFSKYQALGNDYLVLEAADAGGLPSPAFMQRLCDRHFGVGADGVLLVGAEAAPFAFSVRIFNPDGSEAEKSGNGLRILARYFWDRERVRSAEPFIVETPAGAVQCEVAPGGGSVLVQMGTVSFRSGDIPVSGPDREVLRERLDLGDRVIEVSAAGIGNPHCVVIQPGASSRLAHELGPRLERHPSFPRRTNVQFVEVLGPHAIRIEIWERGAGYTLASGSSSCAAASVCVRLGLCESPISVQMPGGTLEIEVGADFAVAMSGPAERVLEGVLVGEFLRELARSAPQPSWVESRSSRSPSGSRK
jgi:diaminopimelate epimerase